MAELKLAAHIACHASTKTIDHLGELLKDVGKGKGSALNDIRLHRTKCSKLISKVIAPCMLKELIDDIADSWYSLLVDETTDNATIKHMAVLVKYYSFTQKKSIIDFLGLICTPKTTHDVLHRALVDFMDKVGLRKDRCMGLGCDGALNLCGAHHSLFVLLKKDCPNLHLVKCICHGLDKCASKASLALPGTLEDLVRDSRGWFSNSACRKFEYQREYEVGISFFLFLTACSVS